MKKALFAECKTFQLKPWQCPPVLFIVMGFFIILSMLATYLLAQRYTQEPEIAALAVIFIAAVSLTIGTFIVNGFNRMVDVHRIKSQFISLASHQLRSPLSVLKWTLEMGKSDYQTYSSQELENFMHTLTGATEHMISIVDSLLDMNRIEAGTLVVKKEALIPGDLAQKAVARFRASLQAARPEIGHGTTITVNLAIPDGLPNVYGDPARVIAILQQLLDNAARYTPGKGVITMRLEKDAEFVIFSVEDYGIGIGEQDQRRIFEKFFRSSGASQLQTQGAGIGLYIARAIIERLGGTIGFTSEQGKGSRFFFTLPIRREGSV